MPGGDIRYYKDKESKSERKQKVFENDGRAPDTVNLIEKEKTKKRKRGRPKGSKNKSQSSNEKPPPAKKVKEERKTTKSNKISERITYIPFIKFNSNSCWMDSFIFVMFSCFAIFNGMSSIDSQCINSLQVKLLKCSEDGKKQGFIQTKKTKISCGEKVHFIKADSVLFWIFFGKFSLRD
jgi:hypothetical protein